MRRVVIVGGGFAGSTLAKNLENIFDVTLIDNKSYFEFTPGVLRAIVHPTTERKMQIEHKNYLKNTKIILGKVNQIEKGFVIVNSRKVKYDYLVLATGSSYKAPFKHPQLFSASRARELSIYNRHIVDGKHILIIGGGFVGVELAGEIGHYYCGKKITLVASKLHLLDRMPVKAQEYALQTLQKMGVEIIFDEKVAKHEKKIFVTQSGKKMKGEVAFACMGITPNSDVLKKNFRDKINNRGFANVDEFLRLQGEKYIFVAGDLTNIEEEKTAQNAERHAKLIAMNIILDDKGKDLVKYHKKSAPMVISLGPKDGIFVKGNFVLTGAIPALMKWFVEKIELMKKRC